MLDFFGERGKCLHGHAEAMTILTRNQIVLDTYFIPADSMRPADHSLWETASSFQSALKKNRYSKSVYNYYYRSVVLLLIFLEKNDLALTKEIAELWFEHAKPLSGKSWKSMRRALYQFLHFADTGEIIPAFLFVGVMTYSQYPYVEAFINEKQRAWIAAHVHMYEYFGGVTRILVPDNM